MKVGWETWPFEECIERVTYTTKIQRKDFQQTGRFPIVSQEEAPINGYWDNPSDLFQVARPVVIFGDHTKCFKYVDFDFVLGADGVKILKPIKKLDPEFFYYQLCSIKLEALGYARHYRLLKQTEIYAPPLDEQRRIVAVLDKAFAGIATATANAQKNLTNARTLFASYLHSIFDQANSEWIERSISSFSKVFDGPHATPKTVDAGPVFLGISALQDGEIILSKTRHVTPVDFARWTKRVVPKAGDVVFSYETRLGQVALIPEGLECCLGRRMGLVRLDRSQVNPMFFVFSYLAPPFQSLLKEQTIKGATVDRIALKDFPSFRMKIPNIDLQEKVVEDVRNMKLKIAQLEGVYQNKLAALAELKQSLLQKAFAGELT